MKRILLTATFIFSALPTLLAADGYKIKLKLNGYSNDQVYLAHYYGKALPTIYKVDSAKVDANGNALFSNIQEVIGGIYILYLNNNKGYFEFLLDNGKTYDITADVSKLPLGAQFKNDAENSRFAEYVNYLSRVGQQHQQMSQELRTAKTKQDTTNIQNKAQKLSNEVSGYRKDYVKKYPNSLLANIFNALERVSIPTDLKDEARYAYYRSHYWDNVDFADERLIYTPLLDNKMHDFFDNIVPQIADTVIAEADKLIRKSRASKEMFKYVMHWLATYTQETEVMGIDAVFVHLVEYYYMKGEAFWLSQNKLEEYIKRAQDIAPNVIGNVAPGLDLKKMDGGDFSLHDVKAKYTLLIFWSPDCGHCEEEMPRIDSLYKAGGYKEKGVEIIGVNTLTETKKWKMIVEEKKLKGWTHAYDPERSSRFRAKYDVYGTPSIYLLDERKIIRGKKLDHTNIPLVIEFLEERAAKN